MEITITTDAAGHYLCTLDDGETRALVTASNVPQAGEDLLAALDDVRESGLGECPWEVPGGYYRWMFRRDGQRLTVVVLWSSGTITGWQHVFRGECDFEPFAQQAQLAVASAALSGGASTP